MTVVYILLAFVGGFFFGIFATALAAMSADKKNREALQKLEDENEELQSDVNTFRHRISDAMAEVAHIRSQYNKTRAELELLKKNGGDKRPVKTSCQH